MIVVRFSDVDEFLEELEQEGKERVDGGLIRVTKIATAASGPGNFVDYAVEAGFTVPRSNLAVNLIPRTQLTLFSRIVGSVPRHYIEWARDLQPKLDALVHEIEVGAGRLGLDVRAGSYTYLLRQKENAHD